jgi:hypothetical protein
MMTNQQTITTYCTAQIDGTDMTTVQVLCNDQVLSNEAQMLLPLGSFWK